MAQDPVIKSINALLDSLSVDPQYEEVRYNIRQLRRMDKLVGGYQLLSYNCDTKVLEIPDSILELPHEDQIWMLIHEACHLSQGHDEWLRRGVEWLDRLCNRYLDTLHKIFEYNANLQTIRLCGKSLGADGLPAWAFQYMCKVGESEIDAFIQHMDNHIEEEIPLALRGMLGYNNDCAQDSAQQQEGSPDAYHN